MDDDSEEDGGGGVMYTVIGVLVAGLIIGGDTWNDHRIAENYRRAAYDRLASLGERARVTAAVDRHHDDVLKKSTHGRRWRRRTNEAEYRQLMDGLVRQDLAAPARPSSDAAAPRAAPAA